MKATLDKFGVITVQPETVSELLVIDYLLEDTDNDSRVVILAEIYDEDQEKN